MIQKVDKKKEKKNRDIIWQTKWGGANKIWVKSWIKRTLKEARGVLVRHHQYGIPDAGNKHTRKSS